MTNFGATNCDSNTTDWNNSFPSSTSIPEYWIPGSSGGTFDKLKELLELRSKTILNYTWCKPKNRGLVFMETSSWSDLDIRQKETNEEINIIKYGTQDTRQPNEYKNLEDLVYRLQLTSDEIIKTLDIKHKAGSTTGYTLLEEHRKLVMLNWC